MIAAFRAHGRVQGVGFRAFARDEARLLGLGGWVRNEPDRTVSGEVEGEPELLEQFRAALERGNGFSRTSRLDWTPLPVGTSLPLPFQVRF